LAETGWPTFRYLSDRRCAAANPQHFPIEKGERFARLSLARCPPQYQPTISLPEKNCAISIAAVSGASEPWTEFSPIDFACCCPTKWQRDMELQECHEH